MFTKFRTQQLAQPLRQRMKSGIVLVAVAALVGAVCSQETTTTPEINPLCSSERQRVLIWRAQYLLQQLKKCLNDPTEAPTLEPITNEPSTTETQTTTESEEFLTTSTIAIDFDTEPPTTQGSKRHRSRLVRNKKSPKHKNAKHHDKKHDDKNHHNNKHQDNKHHDNKHKKSKGRQNHKAHNKA